MNIDHVATIRNARGEGYPDPARAAEIAMAAGADGITAHLREDRRHISDADIDALAQLTRRRGKPLNLEMAVTPEMEAIALAHLPHAAGLVPERREEVTTEGGLDVAGQHNTRRAVRGGAEGAPASASPSSSSRMPAQIQAAADVGAQVVELHTGRLLPGGARTAPRGGGAAEGAAGRRAAGCRAGPRGARRPRHRLRDSRRRSPPFRELAELNIGHFLIGEAIFTGLDPAIRRMRALMDAAETRDEAAA